MKKLTIGFVLILISFGISAQITPSVYIGTGIGTNLGGTVGIGGEARYKFFSVNAAVGMIPSFLDEINEFPEHTGDKTLIDYDFGIKAYTNFGLFGGINYGLIAAQMYSDANNQWHLNKTRGFSFTTGFKLNFNEHIFASAYIGLTSKKEVNSFTLFGDKSFIPRMGIMLGYDF